MAKLREEMDDTGSTAGKTIFNKESEGNTSSSSSNINSVKKLHKMLSSSSMRGSSIEEEKVGKSENSENEKSGGEENKRNDLRNISEEKDETTSDERKRESKLIDFSPDQVRPGKFPGDDNPEQSEVPSIQSPKNQVI